MSDGFVARKSFGDHTVHSFHAMQGHLRREQPHGLLCLRLLVSKTKRKNAADGERRKTFHGFTRRDTKAAQGQEPLSRSSRVRKRETSPNMVRIGYRTVFFEGLERLRIVTIGRERVDFCHVESEWNSWAGIRDGKLKTQVGSEINGGRQITRSKNLNA